MSKIGRNDPCPCGSGNKYKRCCLGKATPTQPVAPQGIPPVPTVPVRGIARTASGHPTPSAAAHGAPSPSQASAPRNVTMAALPDQGPFLTDERMDELGCDQGLASLRQLWDRFAALDKHLVDAAMDMARCASSDWLTGFFDMAERETTSRKDRYRLTLSLMAYHYLWTGRTPAGEVRSKVTLVDDRKAWLDGQCAAYASLYEIVRSWGQRGLRLRDLLTGEEHLVIYPHTGRRHQQHRVILARLVHCMGGSFLAEEDPGHLGPPDADALVRTLQSLELAHSDRAQAPKKLRDPHVQLAIYRLWDKHQRKQRNAEANQQAQSDSPLPMLRTLEVHTIRGATTHEVCMVFESRRNIEPVGLAPGFYRLWTQPSSRRRKSDTPVASVMIRDQQLWIDASAAPWTRMVQDLVHELHPGVLQLEHRHTDLRDLGQLGAAYLTPPRAWVSAPCLELGRLVPSEATLPHERAQVDLFLKTLATEHSPGCSHKHAHIDEVRALLGMGD